MIAFEFWIGKAVGVPLQLYAPYFCPGYFNSTSPWKSFTSDTNLTGCHDYNFEDVSSQQSRAFHDDMFGRGAAAGMASFEPDFMNQN